MIDTISQCAIFVLGTLSIVLLNMKNRWGVIAGLLSQPFWYYTTYVHQQWPMFWFNLICTTSWVIGFYIWFLKKERNLPLAVHLDTLVVLYRDTSSNLQIDALASVPIDCLTIDLATGQWCFQGNQYKLGHEAHVDNPGRVIGVYDRSNPTHLTAMLRHSQAAMINK